MTTTHEWKPPFSAASNLCGALVMRDGGGDECGLHRDHPVHRVPGQAVDSDGHYCGQNVETGQMTPSPDGNAGFCGPDCSHCAGHRIYVIQDGVYVCAADYDYERERD